MSDFPNPAHGHDFPDMQTAIGWARKVSKCLEPSKRWQNLWRVNALVADDAEIWHNHLYEVTVRRHEKGWRFDPDLPWVQIGISCHHGDARHDWRDFQRIKNDVCGADWEAIELYPAESRLLDPSNYYMLWAAPKIPIGKMVPRYVISPENAIAPQRPWHPHDQPDYTDSFTGAPQA